MNIVKVFRATKNWIRQGLQLLKVLPWGEIAALFVSSFFAFLVFHQLKTTCFKTFDATSVLTNLMTINGVFSAILITYLFSRVTWTKDRKLECYKETISLSQKITEFRRIAFKLTSYFNVWDDDKSTVNLIDHGKFKNIDFYDFRLKSIRNYVCKDDSLIEELWKHPDFSEGRTTLYLAMVSLVRNRKRKFEILEENLLSDYETKGKYDIRVVERWLDCQIFNTIWYWLDKNPSWINYNVLKNDGKFILDAAVKFDEKYKGHELNNELLKNISNDISTYQLRELYILLKDLKKGIQKINLALIILISLSLFFGVLIPFSLMLTNSKESWFTFLVALTASINTWLISYFIIKFPFLINKELKWI